jgi:hypothetical protein
VEVTVDLGAGAPIEVVRQVIDDLDTVCQFDGKLQYQAATATPEWAVLRSPSDWIREQPKYDLFGVEVSRGPIIDPRGRVSTIPAAILAPAVSRYLEENNSTQDTITTVESIRYSNPIEFVLGAGFVTAVVVLGIIRDWAARRRVNAAVAADVENTATIWLMVLGFFLGRLKFFHTESRHTRRPSGRSDRRDSSFAVQAG